MTNRLFTLKGVCFALALLLALGVFALGMSRAVFAEDAPGGNQPIDAPADQPVDQPIDAPVDQPGDQPADGELLTTGEAPSDEEETSGEASKKTEYLLAAIGAGIALVFVAIIVLPGLIKKDFKKITSQQLTESALMIAVATVCSVVKIDLPFGGGVTIVSMLPLIIISHRYGWRWGLTTAFVYSLIQLVLGLDNVGYATSTVMAFGVIFLDYIVAYSVIGLSGMFGQSRKSVAVGITITFLLRFACHYVTGVWIWKEWMPETFFGLTMTTPWLYSALYNGWYMLVEFVITMLVAMLIYKPLEKYFRTPERKEPAEA